MKTVLALALLGLAAFAEAQRDELRQPTTTPVPILRQVNKVNEDGSYTYGYENADGSYKIETKNTNGQVQGKYGYYDNEGTLREVEYGASKEGFYPQGTDINAPVVAVHKNEINAPTDGSYDRNLYELPYAYNNQLAQQADQAAPAAPVRRVKAGRRQNAAARQLSGFQQQQPAPQQQQYQQQYQQPAPVQQQQQYQQYQPQQQYQQQPQQYQPQQQQYQPQHYQQQAQATNFNQASHFQGHPARNIDLNTGSYSVNYSG